MNFVREHCRVPLEFLFESCQVLDTLPSKHSDASSHAWALRFSFGTEVLSTLRDQRQSLRCLCYRIASAELTIE